MTTTTRVIFIASMMAAIAIDVATRADAASFDCAKATTPKETLICGDKNLSDLDAR